MNIKLGKIKDTRSAVNDMLNSVIPVKLSYQLSKMLKKLDNKIRDIDKMGIEVAKKYGGMDEKTGAVNIPPEKLEEANKEFNDYLETSVDLDVWELKLSVLSAAGIKLTPAQVISMEDFITNDEEKAA